MKWNWGAFRDGLVIASVIAVVAVAAHNARGGDLTAAIQRLDQRQTKPLEVRTKPVCKLLVYTTSWCGPCQQWKAREYPRLVELGWKKYIEFRDGSSRPAVPAFEVRVDGELQNSWTGYQSTTVLSNSMLQAYNSAKPLTNASNIADFQPTPYPEVWAALAQLNLKSSDTFVDYGCGDGRACIAAVQGYGCRAIGVEIDPAQARRAKLAVEAVGLADRIEIRTADATKTGIAATAGFVYLWPDTLSQLKPKLTNLERFVSYQHQVPGLSMTKAGNAWLWKKGEPTVVQATIPQPSQQYQGRVAHYGGYTYRAPVCNSRGCSMCNSIRRQLGYR